MTELDPQLHALGDRLERAAAADLAAVRADAAPAAAPHLAALRRSRSPRS